MKRIILIALIAVMGLTVLSGCGHISRFLGIKSATTATVKKAKMTHTPPSSTGSSNSAAGTPVPAGASAGTDTPTPTMTITPTP